MAPYDCCRPSRETASAAPNCAGNPLCPAAAPAPLRPAAERYSCLALWLGSSVAKTRPPVSCAMVARLARRLANLLPYVYTDDEPLEHVSWQGSAAAAAETFPRWKVIPMDGRCHFCTDQLRIYHDDILKTTSIPHDSVDLIVTSPPYNVDVQYNSHDDTTPYDHYLEFNRRWLDTCYRLTKDSGRFCLNVPLDKNRGGQQSVYADFTTIAKQVGWRYHSTIIWNEQNISRRTAWGSWLSATAPFVIAPVEVIVVLYKGTWKRDGRGRTSDITRDEFSEWTNGVWSFSGESKKRIGHPAPFPVELPRRCIKLFSFVNDIVLDPFLGSGSTLVACAITNRQGIGVDVDREYCELARRRLLNEGGVNQLRLDLMGGVQYA